MEPTISISVIPASSLIPHNISTAIAINTKTANRIPKNFTFPHTVSLILAPVFSSREKAETLVSKSCTVNLESQAFQKKKSPQNKMKKTALGKYFQTYLQSARFKAVPALKKKAA